MGTNFDCCYSSVGNTFCYYHEKECDDLENDMCQGCKFNNSCFNCTYELSGRRELCEGCENYTNPLKEEEKC